MIQISSMEDLKNITKDTGILYYSQILQVFLFDKSLPTRKIFGQIFNKLPFNPVQEFSDVKQLLRSIAETKGDVLVVWDLDGSIPIEAFFGAIKQLPRKYKTFVIAVIGAVDKVRLATLKDLGLNGYLERPISTDAVRKILTEVAFLPTHEELDHFHSRHGSEF